MASVLVPAGTAELEMLTFWPEREREGWQAHVEIVLRGPDGSRDVYRFALAPETLAEVADDIATTALTLLAGHEPRETDDYDPRRREWGGWP